MAFEDFDAARREAHREPIAFQLAGERFECLSVMPASVMFDYARAGETVPERYEASVAFVGGVLADDDAVDLFRKVLDSRSDPIDYATLSSLVVWLIGIYTGRPTTRPSDSPDGPSSDGPSSKPTSREGSGKQAGAPRST